MLLPNYANIMIVNKVTKMSDHGHRSNLVSVDQCYKQFYCVTKWWLQMYKVSKSKVWHHNGLTRKLVLIKVN